MILSVWLFLNFRAGTFGLVRTVANGYYFYRRKGCSHQESIAREIGDRYRFLSAGKDVVTYAAGDELPGDDLLPSLKLKVKAIFE